VAVEAIARGKTGSHTLIYLDAVSGDVSQTASQGCGVVGVDAE